MSFNDGDLVEVRSSSSGAWFPGEVDRQDAMCYHVMIDPPFPTADQWEGRVRRYAGGQAVTHVTVNKQVTELDPSQLIRARS